MLPDPLRIGIVSEAQVAAIRADITGTVTGTLMSIPLVTQDGLSSKRMLLDSVGVKTTVSINHSETNENKPFVTGRTVFRIDRTIFNAIAGKPSTLSAYAVLALPQSPDFTVDDMLELARSLGFFLAFGQVDADCKVTPASDLAVQRLIASES